jgi:rhamnosyltransferase
MQVPPRKENICAIVVSYYPEGDLLARLRALQAQVAELVLVDNGTSPDCATVLQAAESELGIQVIWNGRNLGIAAALNQGARWASERGYSWVLTLDQDTVVFSAMIESLAKVFDACNFSGQLAVIGSNFRHAVGGQVLDEFRGTSNKPYKEVTTVITSGSLISLSKLQDIGAFREEFFLDCVDFEYCLRARAHGFRVILTRDVVMSHSIGHVKEHSLVWKKTGSSNYPPLRQYFMTRNTLILAREYTFKAPLWVVSTLWTRAKSLILTCLFENELKAKLRFVRLGFLDGIRGRTGRFA